MLQPAERIQEILAAQWCVAVVRVLLRFYGRHKSTTTQMGDGTVMTRVVRNYVHSRSAFRSVLRIPNTAYLQIVSTDGHDGRFSAPCAIDSLL
jgi:hypothetical protein